MFLVSTILGLPLAPVRGVIRLAEILQREAETELYGRGNARRQLEELAEAKESGRISGEQEGGATREVLGRVLQAPAVSEPGVTGTGGEER